MKTERHVDLSGCTTVAVFDDDKTRRFDFLCRWKPGPIITACLLNPAMLEVDQPDHTGAAIIARARKWGYAGARIVNPFTIRTADPEVMKAHPDPIGNPEADRFIVRAMKASGNDGSPFIVGWGKDGSHLGRDEEIATLAKMIRIPLMAFRVNHDGSPTHPARLAHDLPLIVWRPA